MQFFRPCALIALVSILSINALCQSAVDNPVKAKIRLSNVKVNIENFIKVPNSSNSTPWARINMVKPSRDRSGRLFVNDLRGRLYVINDGSISLYLNLKSFFDQFVDNPGLGVGFASFDFHPDFESNGKFYTAHYENSNGLPDLRGALPLDAPVQGVVTEWTLNNPGSTSFTGTHREIVRIDHTSYNHGIQEIAFNPYIGNKHPDYGNLYVSLGDGSQSGEVHTENIHQLNSILGTIMRIDPLGTNGRNGKYGIPLDNPFVDGDTATLDEIYAWGFRNSHRMTWDPINPALMLAGETGQSNLEEVNMILPGKDYGWDKREGTFLYDPNNASSVYPLPANDADFDFTYPVAQYDHDEGRAIVGGFIYRGIKIPALYGKYVFGDIVNGRLFYINVDDIELGSQAVVHEIQLRRNGIATTLKNLVKLNTSKTRVDLRFGTDDNGEIYILTKTDAMIYKVSPEKRNPRDSVWREDFATIPEETPVNQRHINNPDLSLHKYGAAINELKKSHHVNIPLDPFYIWSGRCNDLWAVSFSKKSKDSFNLFGEGASIEFLAWQSNRSIRVIAKTSDDDWIIADTAFNDQSNRWKTYQFIPKKVVWKTFDIDTYQIKKQVDKDKLLSIKELGFTDLQAGDGSNHSSRIDWLEIKETPTAFKVIPQKPLSIGHATQKVFWYDKEGKVLRTKIDLETTVIIDLLGNEVYKVNSISKDRTIDLSFLPEKLYVIKGTSDSAIYTIKISR